MRLGIHVSQDGLGYSDIKNIAKRAEKRGLDSLWVLDHLHASPRPDMEPMLECLTLLSALAVETEKIKLGPLVLNINNHNPAILAKMAATIDQISDGRLIFGIGAGGTNRAGRQKALGYEYEFDAYGISFPMKPITRIKKLAEGLEIIKRMWTENRATYSGEYYTIRNAICLPKPVQKPHPPIWIGSTGKKRMIKIIAKYADGWDMSGTRTIDEFNQKIIELKIACRQVGRNPREIETSMRIAGTIEECNRQIREYKGIVDLGILRSPKGEEVEYLKELEY